MSEKAFLFVSNTALLNISPGSDVTFNDTAHEEEGIDEPGAGGSQIRIRHHGKYLYSFKVDGVPAVEGAPNLVALARNGVILPSTQANNNGTGIVDLHHDDVITLRLANNSPGGVLALDSINLGGGNNAELTLVLIDS